MWNALLQRIGQHAAGRLKITAYRCQRGTSWRWPSPCGSCTAWCSPQTQSPSTWPTRLQTRCTSDGSPPGCRSPHSCARPLSGKDNLCFPHGDTWQKILSEIGHKTKVFWKDVSKSRQWESCTLGQSAGYHQLCQSNHSCYVQLSFGLQHEEWPKVMVACEVDCKAWPARQSTSCNGTDCWPNLQVSPITARAPTLCWWWRKTLVASSNSYTCHMHLSPCFKSGYRPMSAQLGRLSLCRRPLALRWCQGSSLCGLGKSAEMSYKSFECVRSNC